MADFAHLVPYADLTLLLGAESFLQGARKGVPPDPWSEHCFTVLVNLAVNCPVIKYSLPAGGADADVARRWTVDQDTTWHVTLQETAGTDDMLEPSVEERVAHAFDDELRTWNSHHSGWVAFQLLHPLVAAQHRTRVGNTSVPSISNAGLHHWHTFHDDLWERYQERKPLRALEPQIGSAYSTAVAHFSSPAEFAVCYAYDVFRRGWVYQGRAAAAATSYVPHEYRDAALEFQQQWDIVDAIRGLTFSWGRYFVRLVQSDPHERRIEQVAQRIDDVRRVCQELLITPWVHAVLPNIEAAPAADEWECFERRLLSIDAAARKAGLPLLPFDDVTDGALGREALGATFWALLHERFAHFNLKLTLAVLGLELTYLLLKEKTSIGVFVEQEIRNEANVVSDVLHKAKPYGYPGLVPTTK